MSDFCIVLDHVDDNVSDKMDNKVKKWCGEKLISTDWEFLEGENYT